MKEVFFNKLYEFLPKNRVMTSVEEIFAYSHDNNCKNSETEKPFAVILPVSMEEVSKIVKLCNTYGVPVIARGAGTNHVGACVAKCGGIILHFSKMNKILEISPDNLYVKVEPGVTIGEIQAEVEKLGLFFPPDPSNLRVSTIGGGIALRAGGPRGLKYGGVKDYVLNLNVVLADGSVISTGANCSKNAVGYNLTQLFTGAEGTLGIITQATLRLIPKPQCNKIILAYFDTIEDASVAVNKILSAGIVPSVIDLLDKFTIQTIEDFMPSNLNTGKEALLFIEIDGFESSMDYQENVLKKLLKNAEFQVISDENEKQKFWTARRASFAATCKLKGNVITEDVVVERTNIPTLVSGIKNILKKYSLTACIMGHAGDGNIHPNFALDFDDEDEMNRFYEAKDELFELAISLNGAISGEHGIGFEKSKYLVSALDKKNIELFKDIKKIFDPKNIFNPSKIWVE